MTKKPLAVTDRLMSLRAKSWALSRKEDDLLDNLHSTMLWRAEVDNQIDKLEKAIHELIK